MNFYCLPVEIQNHILFFSSPDDITHIARALFTSEKDSRLHPDLLSTILINSAVKKLTKRLKSDVCERSLFLCARHGYDINVYANWSPFSNAEPRSLASYHWKNMRVQMIIHYDEVYRIVINSLKNKCVVLRIVCHSSYRNQKVIENWPRIIVSMVIVPHHLLLRESL